MKVLLLDRPQEVTVEELERDLELLPQWRRDMVLAYKFHMGRVLSAKAYLLLAQGVSEVWGIDEPLEFVMGKHGKPSLKGHPEVHFNLSHCHSGVLCVVDDRPVGCDIERIVSEVKMDLCRYCMSDEEIATITSATNPCLEFTRLWTMKEAILKLTGEGINKDMHYLLSSPEAARVQLTTVTSPTYVYSIARWA